MILTGDRILDDFVRAFGGRENFSKFLDENVLLNLDKTVFDFDWTDEDQVDEYKVICLLSLFDFSFSGLLYDISKGSFRTVQGNQKYIGVLNHFNYILNTHGSFLHYWLYEMSVQICPGTVHDGMLITLFGRLFGHSCMPNVEEIIVGNKMVYYTTKPVKAGEQLFMSRR
jgi:hypothetical protein